MRKKNVFIILYVKKIIIVEFIKERMRKMNKISKVYLSVAMITSVLIFLFGLYFSTKGIVEVMYESWRAMGVSCFAFLLVLFSMMKLPFKIKQRILGLELMFITVLFAPMILKGTIPNFQLSPFVVIADITIVYTVVGLMILWMNNRRGHQGKIDSIFTSIQILMIINAFYDHFSFGIEVMDHAGTLQIGQVLRTVFLGTMNLQILWIAFGILILIGSLLKMVYNIFMLKRESIISVSK